MASKTIRLARQLRKHGIDSHRELVKLKGGSLDHCERRALAIAISSKAHPSALAAITAKHHGDSSKHCELWGFSPFRPKTKVTMKVKTFKPWSEVKTMGCVNPRMALYASSGDKYIRPDEVDLSRRMKFLANLDAEIHLHNALVMHPSETTEE